MTGKEIKLKVAEAIQDDVNKGIVRIDSNFMHQIGVRPGDIVEIKGERTTVGIVDRAYPGDIGLNIIRMDGVVRRNAKTGISETVLVKKSDIKEAKKVVIAPAQKGIIIRASPIIFKRGLLGRAVQKGDIVSLGGTNRRRRTMGSSPFFNDIFSMLDENMTGFGFSDIKFIVAETDPKQAVIISENTEIKFNPEAVELTEEKVLEVTYEDIGGLKEEIKKIREMVELPLKHPEIFERLGIEPPKGVLLHGPPGTGKTLLAKAVANESQANFILVKGPELLSKWVGESERGVRKIFKKARQTSPTIIFFDEMDSLAPRRGMSSESHVTERVVNQLLTEIDGLEDLHDVVIIAATNRPDIIDPGLLRPGRFDRIILADVPDEQGRERIFNVHTKGMPLAKDVNLKELSKKTEGYVGADIEAICREAAIMTLRDNMEAKEVNNKYFEKALEKVRASATEEIKQAYKDVREFFSSAKGKQMKTEKPAYFG